VAPARGIEHHLIFGDSGLPPHGRALMPLPSFDPWHPERLTATLAFWRFAQNPRSSPAAPVKLLKPSAKTLESAFLIWALDLDRAGSSARDIARALFDEAPPDWEDSSSRSRIRRLLRKAEAMSAGKYRLLLKPSAPRRETSAPEPSLPPWSIPPPPESDPEQGATRSIRPSLY
jgi:hypothetical protein